MFEEGKSYLICCGYGWVLCGRAVKPAGVFAWHFADASYIVSTGGKPWPELARSGPDQNTATEKIGDTIIGIPFIWAMEWKGKLPS